MSVFGDIRAAMSSAGGIMPISLAPPGSSLFSGATGRGERSRQLETMGSLGTIFAIVDGIASAIGGVKWELYRRIPPGPGVEPERVWQHPVLDLVSAPNDFFSTSELFEVSAQHQELTGESWWVIARDSRSPLPLELWPVRPDRIDPIPDSKAYLAGYVYTGPSGERVPLDIEDVIFIRRPSPIDAYRGCGPIQSVLTDIDASRYTAEWNRNFFLNSAEPGGIIKFAKSLSDVEFRRFRDRWREQHQGVAQAHRVAILEQGEWVDRKFSMRDMQFKELREVNAEVIRRAWRWPSSMLGDSGHVNRATAEADEYMVGKWILQPRLRRFVGGLNELVRMFYPPGVESDVEFRPAGGIVPENEEAENAERDSRTRSWAALVGAGGDPAWAAEVAGLPEPPKVKAPPAPLAPATSPRARPEPAASAAVHQCPGCGLEDVVRL